MTEEGKGYKTQAIEQIGSFANRWPMVILVIVVIGVSVAASLWDDHQRNQDMKQARKDYAERLNRIEERIDRLSELVLTSLNKEKD